MHVKKGVLCVCIDIICVVSDIACNSTLCSQILAQPSLLYIYVRLAVKQNS